MALLVKLILSAALMICVHQVLRRVGKWTLLVIFGLIPLALTPHWLSSNAEVGLFPWLKLYTIIITMAWVGLLRFTSLKNFWWARLCVVVLLIVNVLEAMGQDLVSGDLSHHLVVASGLLLLLTLPHPCHAISIEETPECDLLYRKMTRLWIIEYTIWNWCFVYLNFPEIAGQQLSVLAAAFVIGMLEPQRWLFARGNTLVADLLLLATFPDYLISLMDTTHWSTPDREYLVSLLCLGICSTCAIRIFLKAKRSQISKKQTTILFN